MLLNYSTVVLPLHCTEHAMQTEATAGIPPSLQNDIVDLSEELETQRSGFGADMGMTWKRSSGFVPGRNVIH